MIVQLLALAILTLPAVAQDNDTLGIANGYITHETTKFRLKLVKDSQVLASLVPDVATSFDFLPNTTLLDKRAANQQYHTGDLIFRYRTVGESQWIEQDTSAARRPVRASNATNSSAFASSSIGTTLNNSLLEVNRTWADVSGDLSLTFTLQNNDESPIELGSLGFPIESDSIFTDRTAVDINANCSLIDPNIGLHGGYLRVTRINGQGPAMVITPINDDTPLEGWGFLSENDTGDGYQSATFEGLYQWMPLTLAYMDMEWNATDPWNAPTSKILAPGDSLTVGLRFSLVDSIVEIENAVQMLGVPVARGLPGYIIPQDLEAYLCLDSESNVSSITTQPPGAFTILQPTSRSLKLLPTPNTFGRVRLTVTYTNGKMQTIHYHVSVSAPSAIDSVGAYLNTHHWWTNTSDPFGRAPSFMAVDHSDGVGSLILQEPRVWLAGLCHEAGASWLTMSIKQVAQPNSEEVSKLEAFVHGVLWKTIQLPDYAARQSIFWYDPNRTDFVYDPRFEWVEDTPTHYSVSWSAKRANVTTRAYGYVYPATTYWSLYRVGRSFPEMLKQESWEWYLEQAYRTIRYCFEEVNGTHLQSLWYDGLMGETVIGELLKDLYREGWNDQALQIESLMEARVDVWDTTRIPFGSELGWDCTGQEGVFYWSNYFGRTATVNKTIDTILGYMPTVNHWGYNGNARRYWDFQFDGKINRIERQIHHYGSSLNALPLLIHYRTIPPSPSSSIASLSSYILRLAFAGLFAPLSNIHTGGFASTAFHSWADTLAWDNYTGDYGPAFVGMVLGSATYVVEDEFALGWTAFGGVVKSGGRNGSEGVLIVEPRDPLRRRAFVQPLDLFAEIDAGAIKELRVDLGKRVVQVGIVRVVVEGATPAEEAVLWINQDVYANTTGNFSVNGRGLERKRGGWGIPLDANVTNVSVQVH